MLIVGVPLQQKRLRVLDARCRNTVFRHSFIGIEVPFQPRKASSLWAVCPRAKGNQQKPEVVSKKDENPVTSLLDVCCVWKWAVSLVESLEEARSYARWIRCIHFIASHADCIFFPNIRELLKILAVLPTGSTEAAKGHSPVSTDSTPGWDRQWPRTDSLICPSSPCMVTRWLRWRPTAFAEYLWNSSQEGWGNHHFWGSKYRRGH